MTINIPKIEQLRDHLNKLIETDREDKFNMGEWLWDLEARRNLCHLYQSSNPTCGTAGCLAGHVVIMDQAMEENIADYARETLGLDENEAYHMFMGRWSKTVLVRIKIEETIEYLDQVIQLGSVYLHKKDDEWKLVEQEDPFA
jgi:hypothetical protein